MKQNFVAVETRLGKLDDREKLDKKAADSVAERLTSCEKSIKDVASKSIADVEQKMKSLVKNMEDNSSQVLTSNLHCSLILGFDGPKPSCRYIC